jgi:hypothetical protein
MKHHFTGAAAALLLSAVSIASAQEQGAAAASTTAAPLPAGQVVPPGVVVPPPPPTPEQVVAATAQEAAAAGLGVSELKVGKGSAALPGTVVAVHYTGWLHDATQPDGKGSKFDSSRDRKQPFVFPLGQRRVIRGWDLGVVGMQVGGQRRLVIPAALAYGERGAGNVIPPGATLVFDVELLGLDSTR